MTALLTLAKAHLNIVGNDDDALLEQQIRAATEFIQRYAGNDDIVSYTSGTITFGPSPAVGGDTITLNGIEFTAIGAGEPAPNEFLIGATPEQRAQNFADAWSAYFDSLTEWPSWFPTASADGAVVTLLAGDASAAASAFSMSTTSAAVTLSGETLSGVVTAVPAVLQATLMLVAHLYQNREATLVDVSGQELPFGVWDLLAPYREWSF
jgi:hypothetical protein